MIDVKATILQTIKVQFNKLRKLAINEPKNFKKILWLVIMDDLYDWGVYLGVDGCTLEKLAEKRKDFILCNSIFNIKDAPMMHPYINVNTPQTNDTWKRSWDAPDLIVLNEHFEPISGETCPVCTRNPELRFITLNEDGDPDVDIANLTDCEKMDIYIDSDTGKMFRWDCQNAVWKQVDPQGVDEEDVLRIVQENRQGVKSSLWHGTTNYIQTNLTENASDVSTVDVVKPDDVEDWL